MTSHVRHRGGTGLPESGDGKEGGSMNVDRRIERLLDQLEDPEKTESEVAMLKGKIAYLESMRPKRT